MFKKIAVIGSSSASAASLRLAEEVGREITRAGFALVCGGLGGVMEAVCRGASQVPGHPPIIGILPGKDASDGNPYLDIALPTGMGHARNALVALAGDGVVVIEGCSGTLNELAFAWFSNKLIVALSPSGGIAGSFAGQRLDNRRSDVIHPANSAAEAIALLKQLQ